ncbi:hypothetical protein G7Y89_g5280 [Cudoniella acicularis]|uniref:F-box domain-containing protein n=1 Tax=Cudoniella acicularis TaxID=354080 RepID=A0A8H4RNK8_9HELO|nr:hypothetical protein G7Y89_g5280 [Cudoniella acicularis]
MVVTTVVGKFLAKNGVAHSSQMDNHHSSHSSQKFSAVSAWNLTHQYPVVPEDSKDGQSNKRGSLYRMPTQQVLYRIFHLLDFDSCTCLGLTNKLFYSISQIFHPKIHPKNKDDVDLLKNFPFSMHSLLPYLLQDWMKIDRLRDDGKSLKSPDDQYGSGRIFGAPFINKYITVERFDYWERRFEEKKVPLEKILDWMQDRMERAEKVRIAYRLEQQQELEAGEEDDWSEVLDSETETMIDEGEDPYDENYKDSLASDGVKVELDVFDGSENILTPSIKIATSSNPELTLKGLSPQLHLRLFKLLDNDTSTCLGLTCKHLWAIHKDEQRKYKNFKEDHGISSRRPFNLYSQLPFLLKEWVGPHMCYVDMNIFRFIRKRKACRLKKRMAERYSGKVVPAKGRSKAAQMWREDKKRRNSEQELRAAKARDMEKLKEIRVKRENKAKQGCKDKDDNEEKKTRLVVEIPFFDPEKKGLKIAERDDKMDLDGSTVPETVDEKPEIPLSPEPTTEKDNTILVSVKEIIIKIEEDAEEEFKDTTEEWERLYARYVATFQRLADKKIEMTPEKPVPSLKRMKELWNWPFLRVILPPKRRPVESLSPEERPSERDPYESESNGRQQTTNPPLLTFPSKLFIEIFKSTNYHVSEICFSLTSKRLHDIYKDLNRLVPKRHRRLLKWDLCCDRFLLILLTTWVPASHAFCPTCSLFYNIEQVGENIHRKWDFYKNLGRNFRLKQNELARSAAERRLDRLSG